MKLNTILLLMLLYTLDSCDGEAGRPGQAAAGQAAAGRGITALASEEVKPPKYDIHGLIDPGMRNMVAFAFKAPWQWKYQQSFTRTWNGATPINQIHIRLSAPDGGSSIEFLPTTPYYYQDGATVRSLRMQAAQMGMPQRNNPGEMAPVAPVDYLRHVLLPQLTQYGLRLQGARQQAYPLVQKDANTTESRGWVEGVAGNGRKTRVECVVTLNTTHMGGDVFYQWNVMPIIVETAGDIEQCYEQARDVQRSVLFNQSWLDECNQLTRRGNAVNHYYDQKDAQAVKDFQTYQRDIRQETMRERSASADRRSEAVGDVLSGQQKYEDPTTGERGKLDANWSHVYRDKTHGQVLYTNTPLDASAVDWVELQKVELANY